MESQKSYDVYCLKILVIYNYDGRREMGCLGIVLSDKYVPYSNMEYG